MTGTRGLTKSGYQLALNLRKTYEDHQPLILPDAPDRLLMPEHLLNVQIDLQDFEDPLPLAVVAARDPDSPMSVAAAVRLTPKATQSKPARAVFTVLGEASKHPVVKRCVELVRENDFDPRVIAKVQDNARRFVVHSRKQYMDALRANLRGLLDGRVEPQAFVHDFFELSAAGNLRLDIRKRLILGLLTAETIRPKIKFLFLENLHRLPQAVARELINDAIGAPDKPGLDAVKQELGWIERELTGRTLH